MTLDTYYPDKKEFLRLSKFGNLIPVYKKISADLDTPVSAFLKIRIKDKESFLLESVEGGEKLARYSFLGTQPSLVFKSKLNSIYIYDRKKRKDINFTTHSDPLQEIKNIMQKFSAVKIKDFGRFWGGLVGYIGYDMVRFFERIPDKNPDELKLPDSIFILTDSLLIFDHLEHTIKIVANVYLEDKDEPLQLYNEAIEKINELHRRLILPIPHPEKDGSIENIENKNIRFISNFKKDEFESIVKKAKDYIKKGDIIQVVLSQRFKTKLNGIEPFDIYRKLRSINPSPYMYFLDFMDLILIGSSPEMLVRCEDGLIQTRPIAGTCPRGESEEEERKLSFQLLNDSKEKAEHLMLVDLARNDLGRVSRMGKVEVKEFMSLEKYSHVMHMVSEVRGILAKGKDVYDVLRASFPAGTVSGSPKVRAMEIIEELENTKRGPYAGCVGYFGFSGNMDTCITIRTVIIKDNFAYIQAGAGIVADSLPEREYQESINKAKALIEAIRQV
ncbi:MAG: anthranilate synthase component I [Candidatus Omnitrophica bacterium]|nr:anthranilate synthase component I [Candidatus Omnitrophota bacterium]